MFELIRKGGPVMWPLLLTSVVSLAVVMERVFFIIREKTRRQPAVVEKVLEEVEQGRIEEAIETGKSSNDFVVKTLVYALENKEKSFSNALLRAANHELKRFNQGLAALDTIITLAPLLGLFGTVTGMIHAFGLLGGAELDAPTAITGGIAEALIATAFGLVIAIVALIPYNYLNTRLEEARHDIEDASSHLEILLVKPTGEYENSVTQR